MFKFLKDKLKQAVNVFSKKVEEEAPEVEVKPEEQEVQPEEETKEQEESKEEVKEDETEDSEEPAEEEPQEEAEPEQEEQPEEEKESEVEDPEPTEKEEPTPEPETEKEEDVEEVPETEEPTPEPVTEPEPAEEEKPEGDEDFEETPKTDEQLMAEQEAQLQKEMEAIRKRDQEEAEEDAKEILKPTEKPVEQEPPKKKGFFSRITETFTKKKLSQEKFEELFWELELVLLENNVAVEVIEKIKQDLSKELVNIPIDRNKIPQTIAATLRKSIESLFTEDPIDLLKIVKTKKPFKICLVGINGSGKTTTTAKVAYLFKNNNLDPIVAAADTFRAAAIEQLQKHADSIGIKLIKHDYGSDAAAVAFDAIQNAESKDRDVVIIDTAGRLHSNTNLMDELRKLIRVAKPDLTIFIGESITGNDCIEQAQKFNEAVGIDGIILSKADVDEKGGTAISVSYVTKKPILYLGIGQEYGDLEKFDKEKLLEKLGL